MLCVGASCEPLLCVGGPVPLEARQGRTRQRFGEGGERLLAGCIPVRFRNGVEGAEAVEIMLISRKGGKGWALPKGGWETDEPVEAAAARETLEEAGVRGTLDLPMLGCFSFTSAKEHQSCYKAHIFVMRVVEVLECWPEQDQRQRHWFSIQEALQRFSHAWMRAALMQCILHNGWDDALLATPAADPFSCGPPSSPSRKRCRGAATLGCGPP